MANLRWIILSAAIAAPLSAQWGDLTFDGRPVQIHGFASQGFAVSNDNNYLTMKTSEGSFAFTDFGGNISVQLAPGFHVGAQVYDRNIGQIGRWHPELDWAGVDYRFNDWFGIRAGKVKTVLGLHNDTQDLEFLHTWALLPQSIYPLDLRASSIAHVGGDLYGNIGLKEFGSLSYTACAGWVPNDPYGGYVYGLAGIGLNEKNYNGRMEAVDLHWNTPVAGLVAGAGYLNQAIHGNGAFGPEAIPTRERSRKNETSQFFAGYERERLKLEAEYRGVSRDELLFAFGAPSNVLANSRSFYGAASYRVAKQLELGSYYSRFYADWRQPLDLPSNYIFDKVVTARIDLTSHWDLKIEGHFINGNADAEDALRGFYLQDNPQGIKPSTKLLVVRMGVEF